MILTADSNLPITSYDTDILPYDLMIYDIMPHTIMPYDSMPYAIMPYAPMLYTPMLYDSLSYATPSYPSYVITDNFMANPDNLQYDTTDLCSISCFLYHRS